MTNADDKERARRAHQRTGGGTVPTNEQLHAEYKRQTGHDYEPERTPRDEMSVGEALLIGAIAILLAIACVWIIFGG